VELVVWGFINPKKMSQMDVLTGTQGEIRNSRASPNKKFSSIEMTAN
jgi:hypothetical protein